MLTNMKLALQNPVPRSNQSFCLSSYTFTLFLSCGLGAAACAIIGCSSPFNSSAEEFRMFGARSRCCWSDSEAWLLRTVSATVTNAPKFVSVFDRLKVKVSVLLPNVVGDVDPASYILLAWLCWSWARCRIVLTGCKVVHSAIRESP